MITLINKTAVRNYILEKVKLERPGWKCTRISPEALSQLEARFMNIIDNLVKSHPTKGETFRV